MNTKIALQVLGKRMMFDAEVLETIVEVYMTEILAKRMPNSLREGEWFDIDPTKIDQRLFAEKREDGREEWTRQVIVAAFQQMRLKPEKYARPIQTMRPEKTWEGTRTVRELMVMANELGNSILDWVWLAFEWAQRIANGEAWSKLCNEADKSKYFTLFIWTDGKPHIVGGSRLSDHMYTPTSVDPIKVTLDHEFFATIPGVMRYKK